MKLSKILGIALLGLVCGCSDSELTDNSIKEYSEDTTPSIEYLLKTDQDKYKDWQNSSLKASTRATLTDFTVYGYTSQTSTGNQSRM